MTASLWDVLKEQLAELRETLAGPLPGESSEMALSLFDDWLRMTEIVLAGRWKPLEPSFARFALPFFQAAADTFARSGQPGYAAFARLSLSEAGRFLEHHSRSPQPFGGRHQPTRWSGLAICESVSIRIQNPAPLSAYERVARTLLSALKKRVIHARQFDLQQLVEFISDRCSDARDRIAERRQEDGFHPVKLARERAELNALRAELASQRARLTERENLMEQEWNRFRRERAEFERLRQRWEERWEAASPDTAISDTPAEAVFPAPSKTVVSFPFPHVPAINDDRTVHLDQQMEAARPLATSDEDAEHVLFEDEDELGEGSTNDHRSALFCDGGAGVLIAAVAAGDREQIQTALHWGLDVNSSDPHDVGQTPLHVAARFGKAEIIELLLNAGADAELRDADLRTPLEIAILHEQADAARLLMAHAPRSFSPACQNLLRTNRL